MAKYAIGWLPGVPVILLVIIYLTMNLATLASGSRISGDQL